MQRIFSAQIDQLRPLLQWIAGQLTQAGLDAAAVRKVELACEEAFVNIVHHAYPQQSGTVDLEVRIVPNEWIEVVLKDSGPPFDPSRYPAKQQDIGGLGIPFMRQCVDAVIYRREGDANILILKKMWPTRSSRKR